MPRLFVAIELPRRIKTALGSLHKEIPGVRWVPPEQIHLTLAFLGEVEDGRLEGLCQALDGIVSAPFTLRLTCPGCFPRSGSPRVLWYGLERQPALDRLAERVKDVVTACGIAQEERPFSPHITLARFKGAGGGALKGYLDHPAVIQIPPLTVSEFVLFQSTLSRAGALHRPLKSFPCVSASPE